jgi:hypothetical protein
MGDWVSERKVKNFVGQYTEARRLYAIGVPAGVMQIYPMHGHEGLIVIDLAVTDHSRMAWFDTFEVADFASALYGLYEPSRRTKFVESQVRYYLSNADEARFTVVMAEHRLVGREAVRVSLNHDGSDDLEVAFVVDLGHLRSMFSAARGMGNVILTHAEAPADIGEVIDAEVPECAPAPEPGSITTYDPCNRKHPPPTCIDPGCYLVDR